MTCFVQGGYLSRHCCNRLPQEHQDVQYVCRQSHLHDNPLSRRYVHQLVHVFGASHVWSFSLPVSTSNFTNLISYLVYITCQKADSSVAVIKVAIARMSSPTAWRSSSWWHCGTIWQQHYSEQWRCAQEPSLELRLCHLLSSTFASAASRRERHASQILPAKASSSEVFHGQALKVCTQSIDDSPKKPTWFHQTDQRMQL